uniref:Immunoglobulin V-set domain-containing protein n=1 Tax=Oryctolagus cuniculus TaxID=9986 RepID=G1U5M5_RABIT
MVTSPAQPPTRAEETEPSPLSRVSQLDDAQHRPEPAMGCSLLCYVVLGLLGTVSMDTKITQTPRHLVMGTANKKSLKCEQHLGHNAMYWYKQNAPKPPELMFLFNHKELIENNSVPSHFSPECPENSRLLLHLANLQPGDSAVYLCASSQDTALQSHRLPVHKPQESRKL